MFFLNILLSCFFCSFSLMATQKIKDSQAYGVLFLEKPMSKF